MASNTTTFQDDDAYKNAFITEDIQIFFSSMSAFGSLFVIVTAAVFPSMVKNKIFMVKQSLHGNKKTQTLLHT